MPVDKEKIRVVCVIPTKNCQNTLADVLANFSEEILGYIEEILVVDNGSSDFTVQVARDELAKIPGTRCTILQNSRNFGLGGSHKIAFNYAFENGFDYMLVLHGDNSVSITDFLSFLKNHRYLEYDMLLSSRIHPESRTENYPFHRKFFNRVLSTLASLVARRTISDLTTGGLNCFRVSSYLNKFENPIKRYSNDVSFPHFVTLYGCYRRHRMHYFPITHRERDVKPRDKLISQFGKGVVLLLKYFIAPEKSVDHDVYGTFFGHTFRRIKVRDIEAPVPVSKKPEVTLSLKEENEIPAIPVVDISEVKIETSKSEMSPRDELILIDLQKLRLPDPYNPGAVPKEMVSLEACDLSDDHNLWIRMKLDVETVCSKGLRASFLHLFKIYSPQRIRLEINADRVLRSKQFLDFLGFVSDHGVKTGLVSMNPGNINLWKKFSPLVESISLSFEYGSISREDFITFTSEIHHKGADLYLNILTHHQHFYYCYGLYDHLRANGLQKSLRLQPYLSPANLEKPRDHLELLKNSFVSAHKGSDFREHYQLTPDISLTDAKFMNEGKEFGFTRVFADGESKMKILDLDQRGNFSLKTASDSVQLGSLYGDPSQWSARLTQGS